MGEVHLYRWDRRPGYRVISVLVKFGAMQEYLAHKRLPTPQDRLRSIVLL